MIVADTSGLLALFNVDEPDHIAVTLALENEARVAVSPFVVAELDYLVATRLGHAAEQLVLAELAQGPYQLESISQEDLLGCCRIVEKYGDLAIGVADASLVVIADRLGTKRILTLDRRHFDAIRPLRGGHFELLP